MLFRYAEGYVDCKVAYVSSWPHNLAVDIFNNYFLKNYESSWDVRSDQLEDSTFRIILEPKKLPGFTRFTPRFTPRFHFFTHPLLGLQPKSLSLLLAGSDAVVVVSREEEAAGLLEDARKAMDQAIPMILQIVGPISASRRHLLAEQVPVTGLPEEAFGAVMQALVDRFCDAVSRDADPAIQAHAREFRRWSTLSFGGRATAWQALAHQRDALLGAALAFGESHVTPGTLGILLAVVAAIATFGIIVGLSHY